VRRQAVRVARLSVGGALLVLGVIGAFLPIMQGWIFFLAGLSVMAPESPTAKRALDWVKKRLGRTPAERPPAATVMRPDTEAEKR